MSSPLLLGLFCLLLGASPVFAVGAEDFDAANQQFTAGDFAAAAAGYEQILAARGPCAAVLYNLGNSYQRLGRIGPAILAYERARLLTPRDPDLLANLALARKAAAAFEEPARHPRLEAALTYLSRNELSWLVAGSALVLGGLALVGGVLRWPRPMLRQAAVVLACLTSLAMLAGGTVLYLRRGEASRGIVLPEAATLRLSPFEKAESLGTQGPGKIVHLGEKSGDFHYIEVPGVNLRGWLADKDVAAITPASPSNEGKTP